MITISVVIPTHNRPELLSRAIDSVLNQTHSVDEVIVVDDTNSIGTQDLVSSYNEPRIKFYANPNNGASSSRNLGAELATSDFIAFLDDDDEFYKNKIELQHRKIINENVDAVFSQLEIVYENTDIKYSTRSRMPDDPLTTIYIENFIGGTISSVIRRELFLQVGGFDITLPAREEYDLWMRLITEGASIDIIEQPLAIGYRSLVGRSRISANISNYEKAITLINSKHRDKVAGLLSKKQKRLRKASQFEFLAAQAVSIGLRRVTAEYYLKSFLVRFKIKPLILAVISLVNPTLLIRLRAKVS